MAFLWAMVHQWPTHSVWYSLTDGNAKTGDVNWETLVSRKRAAYCTDRTMMNIMPIVLGRELKIRVGTPGEGTACSCATSF